VYSRYCRFLKALAIGNQARDAVANTEQLETRRLPLRELLPAGIGACRRGHAASPGHDRIGETTCY